MLTAAVNEHNDAQILALLEIIGHISSKYDPLETLTSTDGQNALHHAVNVDDIYIFKLLMQRRPHLLVVGNYCYCGHAITHQYSGITPLHLIMTNDLDIFFKYLIENRYIKPQEEEYDNDPVAIFEFGFSLRADVELYERANWDSATVDLPCGVDTNLTEAVLYFGSPKIWIMLMNFSIITRGMDITKLIRHLFGEAMPLNASEHKWYWLMNYILQGSNVAGQEFEICLHKLLKLRDDLAKLACGHGIRITRESMYRKRYSMALWSPLHEVAASGLLTNMQIILAYEEPADSVYHCVFDTEHDLCLYGFLHDTASGRNHPGAYDGITPLHVAASRGRLAIAKYLIETWNVDPQTETTHFKLNALDFALMFDHKETALYLMEEQGLKPCITENNRSTWRANEVLRQSVDIVIYGYAAIEQRYPLQFSIYSAQHVSKIIKGPVSSEVNRSDERGRTPLYWAISRLRRKATEGIELVQYLIEEQHANPVVRDHQGSTPFHHAALSANLRLLTYLMDMPHIVGRLPQPRAASWHTLHKIRLLFTADQQHDTAHTLATHREKENDLTEPVAQLLYKEAQQSLVSLAQMVLREQKRVAA
ncbi:MAG: ankyrin repeat domain-containing protein [Bacteroidota bacterium]